MQAEDAVTVIHAALDEGDVSSRIAGGWNKKLAESTGPTKLFLSRVHLMTYSHIYLFFLEIISYTINF